MTHFGELATFVRSECTAAKGAVVASSERTARHRADPMLRTTRKNDAPFAFALSFQI